VARRHQHHQALDLTRSNQLQRSAHECVVLGRGFFWEEVAVLAVLLKALPLVAVQEIAQALLQFSVDLLVRELLGLRPLNHAWPSRLRAAPS
jgi:hypothetical protein